MARKRASMAGVPSSPEKKKSKSGEKTRRKSEGGSTAAHDGSSPSGDKIVVQPRNEN